ncbi:MAG: hypothetical protein R6V59_04390 [Dehalococcoidia bacterium]
MRVFRNVVRGFGLVLRDRKGWHRISRWIKIAGAERKFPVARGQIFHDFAGYQLRHLNGILTFICYTDYRVEVLRQLFGLASARGYGVAETKNAAARLVWRWRLGETGD